MSKYSKSAKPNGKIRVHPLDSVKFSKSIKTVDDLKVLTVEEQKKFLEAARRSHNYYQYAFLLETGLRTGGMIALTWDDVDWERRTLTIRKTMELRYKRQQFWMAGPPKMMDRYVHVTDDSMEMGIRLFEQGQLENGLATE